MLSSIKRIHFIGIGGIGMSGIAELLHNQDFTITGSDLSESPNIDRLRELDIFISIGHDKKNIAIRTGHHCAQPLMKYLNITTSARVSIGIYNDIKDLDLFVDSLIEVKNFLA